MVVLASHKSSKCIDPVVMQKMKAFAKTLLDNGGSRDRVRKECAEKFNLTERQVSVRLKKYGIDVKVVPNGSKGALFLSREKRDAMANDAKEMMAKNVSPLKIRKALSKRYGLLGSSVVRYLNSRRIYIDDSGAEKPVSAAQCDMQVENNIFAKAAELVPGARYDIRTGLCYIGKTPITGFALVHKAQQTETGLELPQ